MRKALFIIASAWHMKIGMQVVIEDYVQNEKLKLLSIIANNFLRPSAEADAIAEAALRRVLQEAASAAPPAPAPPRR